MPELDLGPNSYRKRDPRTGRWIIPENPRLAMWMFFGTVVVLALIFIRRDELTSGTLFGGAAMFAFSAGIMFAIWLRNRH